MRQRTCELSTYDFVSLSDAVARRKSVPKSDLADSYEAAVRACGDLIAADKRSTNGYQRRSVLAATAAEIGVGEELFDRAIADLRQITEMYPTNSTFWADLAELNDKAGRISDAKTAAKQAMRIDKSNRRWGHIDRYLSEELVARLTELAEL